MKKKNLGIVLVAIGSVANAWSTTNVWAVLFGNILLIIGSEFWFKNQN